MIINRYYFLILTICLMGGILVTSCGREEMGIGNVKQNDEGNKNLPEWNKNKTIEIYFLSTLDNKTIATNAAEYAPINNYFTQKGKICYLGVIDRADVTVKGSNMYNGSTNTSFASKHFSCFAFNKYNGSNVEGSAILLNHRITTQSSYKVSDDCYFKYIKVLAKTTTNNSIGIEIPFSTVRFDRQEQITASEAIIKELSTPAIQAVIIGTIPTELVANLKTISEKMLGYKLVEVTKNELTKYSIFMLAPKSWVLRETTADIVNKNINAYCLRVEAGVEY